MGTLMLDTSLGRVAREAAVAGGCAVNEGFIVEQALADRVSSINNRSAGIRDASMGSSS
ncbi:hypothetical protein GMST_02630 [Geomonas silvestris]|uniref:Uncharacterized protein n=1 Tax=Geomonas silvestris TaxID=2740184 RepID=A0A6V8MD55_9BACT|nr:hypothetical protein GMST_02630 [Geomonas silvestris]